MKAKAEAKETTREQLREQIRYESAALCLMNELAEAADRCGWHFHDEAEANVWELLTCVGELLDDLETLNVQEITALVQMLVQHRVWAHTQGTSADRETAILAGAAAKKALRNSHRLTADASAAQAVVSAINGYDDMMSARRKCDWEEEKAAEADAALNPQPSTLTGGKEVTA